MPHIYYRYVENWKNVVEQLQKPIQEIIELNVKTFQQLTYLKPEDLSHLKKPEDFLEKIVHILIENSHQSLNYMQQAFSVFENHLLDFSKDIKKKHG
ncbi:MULTISPECIES: phasin family protein [unclassified Legionella]|uniref:phasin family protein n=1 Tax=unclassified Legionella TaxID=2622702 RepID=UPI001055C5C7|nr:MULTISPECIES: phasin family protein [unclassified Legionella]MDI9819320.1 phasin family protein [Legionella sp. PL877]